MHITRYFEYVRNVEENASDYQNAENTPQNEHRKFQANIVHNNRGSRQQRYLTHRLRSSNYGSTTKETKISESGNSNVEVDSDDKDVDLSFEERVENYYQHQLKEKF